MRDDLREAYDHRAADRDAHQAEPWKIRVRNGFYRQLQEAGAVSLLEIGPGPGKTAAWFRDQGLEVVCVDLSKENVRLCQEKSLTANVMDVTSLEFRDAHFDAVYTMNCLLHLPKPEFPIALREIRRVLRSGGLAYIGVYGGQDREGVYDGDEYEPKRFFSHHTDEVLLRMVRSEFEVLSFERIGLAPGIDLHYQSLILQPRIDPRRTPDPPLGSIDGSARIVSS